MLWWATYLSRTARSLIITLSGSHFPRRIVTPTHYNAEVGYLPEPEPEPTCRISYYCFGSRFPQRIVNRLTRDTADVDRQLPNNLGMALRSFLQLLSIIMLMGWAAPLALPPMVVIMLGFSMLFLYYQVRQGRGVAGSLPDRVG